MTVRFSFSSKAAGRLAAGLFAVACALVLASTFWQVVYALYPGDLPLRRAVEMSHSAFYVDRERSFPALYSAYLLLLCAHLLGAITLARLPEGDRYALHWGMLSVVFLFLCVDESLSLHERTIEPLRSVLGAGGVFYFTWVVPALVLLVVFFLFYLGFLAHLGARMRFLFLAAGALYVSGSVGMEMAGGYFWETYGGQSPVAVFLLTVEEFLEMSGAVLFVYALLLYMSRNVSGVPLGFGGSGN